MPRRKIQRTASEERELAEDRKKRKVERQRERRALQHSQLESEPSTSATAVLHQTTSEKAAKLEKARQIKQQKRQNETPDQREERLRKDRERKARKRQVEQNVETERRRENNRMSQMESRMNESSEQNEIRLETQRQYIREQRDNETPEERIKRLEEDRIRYQEGVENRRATETPAERESRISRNRTRIQQKNLQNPQYTTDLQAITTHYIGPLDVKCKHCKATHFLHETHDKDFSFGSCCEKGKVNLQPQNNFPENLKKLFKDEDTRSNIFKKDIRGYMRALSMASIITKEIRFNGGGPYTYRQVGEFQKKFNVSAQPEPEDLPTYGQLFMIEADEANGIRSNIMSQLNKDLLKDLDDIIRRNNPFAQSYMMLKDEIDKASQSSSENQPQFKLLFCLKDHLDKRRFNPPRVNEVAVLFEQGVDGEVPRYELCVNEHGKKLITLKQTHQSAEPLLFTLFYPTGQLGWHPNYKCNEKKITNAEYVKYKLYERHETDSPFCPILYGGKSFQEWLVTQYINIDRDRLDYIKNNVCEHLAENYDYLTDYLNEKAAESGLEIGKKIVLPSSYMGSPRYMTNAYDDALTLTKTYGKPDLFITMTCNPEWPEIKGNLKPGQVSSDRPDLVARVFRIKYKEMIDYVVKSEFYGKIKAYTGSIEFQKRGLPHLHLLLILDQTTKLDSKEKIDNVICAEIPDINAEPELHAIITKNNMHQCKKLNRNGGIYKKFPCIERSDTCSKHFPKKFLEETEFKTGGYANYRRRNNQVIFKAPDGQTLDNRHVVSYTPQLSKKFNCHINVEMVSDIQVVKYLHKYVFKGVDQALVEKVTQDGQGNQLVYDEIQKYIECRYLSAPEAAWRIFGNEIIIKSHTVERLEIHEEGKQFVFFKKTDTKEHIEELKRTKKSKLMAFFELNEKDNTNLLYSEVSQQYTWDRKGMQWKKRLSHFKTVGRIYHVNPKMSELFHLRLLLIRIRGPKSFEELKTFNGIVHPTYKSACLARGFIKDDQDYVNAMQEASFFKMPRQLRFMFSMLLVHCTPTNPNEMYNKFKNDLSEDCLRKYGDPQGFDIAYTLIEKILQRNGKSFVDFQMNQATDFTEEQLMGLQLEPEVELDSESDHFKTAGEEMLDKCNNDQKTVITKIMELTDMVNETSKCIFLDGPGGTGKTFVYKTVYNLIRGKGKKVLCMAHTGIAATLLPEGNTVHSTFKFGLDIHEGTTANIKKGSKAHKEIVGTIAFIIDEASMISKHILEAIDRSLQDLTGKKIPFGGKIMLLGGDFRQILPIQENATPRQTVMISIKGSRLWSEFKTFKLSKNMRAGEKNIAFAKQIIEIGEGKLNNELDEVELPSQCFIKGDIVKEVFGNEINNSNTHILTKRSILAPINVEVDDINEQALRIVAGSEQVYYSRDEIKEDVNERYKYMTEMLNSLGEPNFPKSELKLKVNAVVMVVRNLDLKEGLCNGTRLRIVEMKPNVLKCQCLSGEKAGKIVFIPRITLESTKNLLIPFYRDQFPVRLAFAMTINKSQGQTFEKVGLALSKRQVFTHGQLYVAISRVHNWDGVKIKNQDDKDKTVVNIVFKEVL